LVVGDVHGCIDEFEELLQIMDYKQGRDLLVSLGDLLDRGPEPVACVALAMRLGAQLVKGNHEEKALRWLRHEAKTKADPAYQNPMRTIPEERRAQWRALSSEQIAWLDAAPCYLDLGGGWLGVHGGFEPGLPLEKQKENAVVRVRYVNEKGKIAGLKGRSLSQPEGSVYWTEQWKGPHHVVYGHAVHSREKPRVDRFDHADGFPVHCVGLDTGVVFGGHLTGMVLEKGKAPWEMEFFQVKAKDTYYPFPFIALGVTDDD
jgi:bis(5'-nucleosyl)-tetraphosphatase (symmetrical)